jgi:hypothetical protein
MLSFSGRSSTVRIGRSGRSSSVGAGLAPLTPVDRPPLPEERSDVRATQDTQDTQEAPPERSAPGGWLDSSLELQQGLEVTEGLSPDELPPEFSKPFLRL